MTDYPGPARYTKEPAWAQKAIGIMDYYATHMKQYLLRGKNAPHKSINCFQ